MTYKEFLENIDDYVSCVMEFTGRIKATGEIHKFQRFVWDNKEFGKQSKDCLTEILDVKFVRKGKLTKAAGIIGVK